MFKSSRWDKTSHLRINNLFFGFSFAYYLGLIITVILSIVSTLNRDTSVVPTRVNSTTDNAIPILSATVAFVSITVITNICLLMMKLVLCVELFSDISYNTSDWKQVKVLLLISFFFSIFFEFVVYYKTRQLLLPKQKENNKEDNDKTTSVW